MYQNYVKSILFYFRFGLVSVKVKKDKIFINLSYTPTVKSLKKKFGTLPVRYMRVQIDNEEEFKILENMVRRYKFNLVADDAPLEAGPIKKVLPSPFYPTAPITLNEEDDSEDEDEEDEEEEEVYRQPPQRKRKMFYGGPSSPSKPSTSYSPASSPPVKKHKKHQQQQQSQQQL